MSTCEELEEITCRLNARDRNLNLAQDAVVQTFLGCPMPAWFKDTSLRMTMINSAYTAWFGLELVDYEGKLDERVHSKLDVSEYRKNDLAVLAACRPLRFKEQALLKSGKKCELTVIKYPVRLGGTVIGVAGLVLGVRVL